MPAAPPATAADPTGQPRVVTDGRTEARRDNSGVMVGESRTTNATTGDETYKTEFVKVYQDAGVVGAAMLTLLVLCCLLGLFCSRLIKMYTALTESRDTLEAARTVAIEKLTTSLVLLRSETNSVIAELRRESDQQTSAIAGLAAASERYADRAVRSYDLLERVHDVARSSPDSMRMVTDKLASIERIIQMPPRAGGATS